MGWEPAYCRDQTRIVAYISMGPGFLTDLATDKQLACADRVSGDPCDRIFALLRLLNTEDFAMLGPNYSLLAHEVYRRFVIVCLRHYPRHWRSTAISCLFALVGTETNLPSDVKWPSWVPDYNSLSI